MAYQPVALDQAPVPQLPVPDYKPAQLSPQPQDPGIGYAGKVGKVADLAGNFLQGFVQGKQNAAAMTIKKQNQDMAASWNSFQNDQEKAAQIANDPNSTPAQKQAAEATRQKSYKSYLDVIAPFVAPAKGQNSKGQKQSKAGSIGEHMKAALGIDDPHILSQTAFAALKASGPPPLPQDFQQKKAAMDISRDEKRNNAIDALADARKNNKSPEEIAKLEQNVRDLQGQILSPKEKNDNALAQAAMDERAGKPISDETRKQLQSAGYDPAPVLPNQFSRVDEKGMMWVDSVDPQTGKKISSTQIGKTRVPPDQKEEAQAIFKQNLANLGDMLKKAHPDWTQQQISAAQAQAMLSGQFGVKVAPGMTVGQTQKVGSEAIKNSIYSNLDDDERAEASKLGLFGEKNGSYMMTSDLSKAGGWGWFNWGDKTDQAKTLDAKVRDGARNWLSNQLDDQGNRRYTDEQIDQMVPASIEDAKAKFQPKSLDNPPTGPDSGGGGNVAKKSDVEDFAKAHNMSYDDAVKAVKKQGYTVDEK